MCVVWVRNTYDAFMGYIDSSFGDAQIYTGYAGGASASCKVFWVFGNPPWRHSGQPRAA
jgi:hypothetical protein